MIVQVPSKLKSHELLTLPNRTEASTKIAGGYVWKKKKETQRLQRLGKPPGTRCVYEAEDVDDQAVHITAWYQEYDQIHPGRFHGQIHELWLTGIQLFLETTSQALRQTCVAWPDSFWFGIPAPASTEGFVNSSPLDQDAIAIQPGGDGFELLTPDEFDLFGITIDEATFVRHAVLAERPDLPESIQKGGAFPVKETKKCLFWRRFSNLLTNTCELDDQCCLSSAVCSQIEEEVSHALIDMLEDETQAIKPRYSCVNRCRVVSQARDFVLSQPDRLISIIDLCEHLHVSRRTLQNCFQTVLGVCPVSYLKSLRLNAVRRALKHGGLHQNLTVQDVAAQWGFWHMSQFAADYRALFYELPSETLRGSRDDEITFRYPTNCH